MFSNVLLLILDLYSKSKPKSINLLTILIFSCSDTHCFNEPIIFSPISL